MAVGGKVGIAKLGNEFVRFSPVAPVWLRTKSSSVFRFIFVLYFGKIG